MKRAVVVDSSCDLRSYNAKNNIDYRVVALSLRVGEEEFIDDKNLDVKRYIKVMQEYKGATGSSAPSPGDWCAAFEDADEIFVITVTSNLSGTYGSAVMAKNIYLESHKDKKIHVFDSLSTGPSMMLMLQRIDECDGKGMRFEEIVEDVEQYRKHTHLFFALESLSNLVKGGRISKTKGLLASALGIKILGCASEEGTIELMKKCRGKLAIYESMISEMTNFGYKGGKVIISHCLCLEKAEYFKKLLVERFAPCSVEIVGTGGLCSYYAEEGGMLVGFEV